MPATTEEDKPGPEVTTQRDATTGIVIKLACISFDKLKKWGMHARINILYYVMYQSIQDNSVLVIIQFYLLIMLVVRNYLCHFLYMKLCSIYMQ